MPIHRHKGSSETCICIRGRFEEYFVELHWAVNDMDNFLYETDVYSPEEFYQVVREMSEVIEGSNTDGMD